MNKLILLITLFLFISCQSCQTCQASDQAKGATQEKLVSKKYFIKGMTCGGCILGVKTALNKSTELKISDKDIGVGEATLKFETNNYKEASTDCDVTKTIEKVTEFKVFLDKEHTKRACEP